MAAAARKKDGLIPMNEQSIHNQEQEPAQSRDQVPPRGGELGHAEVIRFQELRLPLSNSAFRNGVRRLY